MAVVVNFPFVIVTITIIVHIWLVCMAYFYTWHWFSLVQQQRSSPSYALFTTDSQLLLTAGYRTIYVWRMGTGQLEFKLSRHQDFVTCLKFALDDRFLVSSSLDHSVAVWDFRTRATVSVIQAQCQVNGFHLSPDLSSLVYVPDRVANVAVVEPNPALRRVLEQGRNVADLSEPETLENASAFATSFNTQKDANRNTSAACVILWWIPDVCKVTRLLLMP